MERSIVFSNQDSRLVGILHVPERANGAGLVFLHGWPGYRVGTHRLAVKAARAAERMGFACLRFDFLGRGDSEGATLEANLVTMISDAMVATRQLEEMTGVGRIALVGDCSGCEVAIGAAPHLPEVGAMVLWSAPIIGGERQAAEAAKRRSVYADYMRKLMSPESWAKLLSGRVRWDMVRRALVRGGKGKGEEGAAVDREVDWKGAFLSFRGERLFIYGGADPVTAACVEFYERLSSQAGTPFELYVVEGANHGFYSVAWEREVIGVTCDWLAQRLGGG